jgi:hypothetical protein
LPDTNWIAIAASVLGGGAAGSIITALVSASRSRKQPVIYRSEVTPAFNNETLWGPDITAKLTLISNRGASVQDLPNLFIASIEIANQGNKDFTNFRLGLTLSEGDIAVHCAASAIDRHHVAQPSMNIGPSNPATEVDFVLTPFNRKDTYKFIVYFFASERASGTHEIAITSPEPVVLKKAPRIGEAAADFASDAVARVLAEAVQQAKRNW